MLDKSTDKNDKSYAYSLIKCETGQKNFPFDERTHIRNKQAGQTGGSFFRVAGPGKLAAGLPESPVTRKKRHLPASRCQVFWLLLQ